MHNGGSEGSAAANGRPAGASASLERSASGERGASGERTAGRVARRLAGWLIAAACAVYIIIYFSDHREDLRPVLAFPLATLCGLIGLHSVQLALFAARYRLVLQECGRTRLPFLPWFRVFVVGRMLSQVFPQTGNVYRAVTLKRDYAVSYTRYASGVFSFAWMDGCLNLTFACLIILALEPGLRIGRIGGAAALAILLAFFAGTPIVLDLLVRTLHLRAGPLAWMHGKVAEVLRVSVLNIRDARYMVRFVLSGAMVFALTCVIFKTYFGALGTPVTFSAVALMATLFKLSGYVNVTPGNLGVRELVYGLLSAQLDLGMSQGILVSVTLRIVSQIVLFGAALPLGGVGLLRHRDRYRDPTDGRA